MRNPNYSTVDQHTGDVTYKGPLESMKGNHNNMPARTEAYLPGDERGHVNASSLGGVNTKDNVVAQHSDLNHGAYYSIEKGERAALQNGATIDSEKTAVVNSQPGDRPTTFTVNDTVTYADGHTESIHHSFTNESYATQTEWNDMSAALPGTFNASNPGDGLRDSMDSEQYASLMEQTDAELPELDAEYAPADYADAPSSFDSSSGASMDVGGEASGFGADTGADAGAGAGDGDGGAAADSE